MTKISGELLDKFKKKIEELTGELGKVVFGQEEVVKKIIISFLCRNHCIITGVPGLAKTTMVRTLSKIIGIQYKRIQFTPDLMPSDIIGTEILQENPETKERSFRFIKGPVFTNFILADEINRASPKTQAALLEAMQERTVTVAGTTYRLEDPFFVMATQNPIEQEGTYPLPEAQLDRFMFNIHIGYPSDEIEKKVVRTTTTNQTADVKQVFTSEQVIEYQDLVRDVPVSEYAIEYAVDLVSKTRPVGSETFDFIKKWVTWGGSPRASQYLILGAKAHALMDKRNCVTCDDIRSVANEVLSHRIIVNFVAEADGVDSRVIVSKLLEKVQPREPK